MSLDTVNAEGIEQGLQRWAANPGPEPEAGFSATSFLGAGLSGFPAAVLEASASSVDAVSGFGNIMAASGGSAGGMFSVPSAAEQKQEAEARDRMLKGDNQSVAVGNTIRRKAAEFAPDPLTSHRADQVLFGLTRFGTKAVAAVGGLGGPAGALLLGLEEGNTVTQDLRERGVDTGTATQVGAVQGTLSAVGAVLPLGGKTIAQTLGLVGVGGPGSFMAQEALSREILQQAGYSNEASLHNPFDPLGLTLSAVIPGAFGAVHMRGVGKRAEAVTAGRVPLEQLKPDELRTLKYDDPRLDDYASATAEKYGVPPAVLLAIKNVGEKSGPTAVSPKGAQGVMQFMPATAKEMGLVDRTDPVASIDAGARYLKKLYDAYGSWDAAVTHYNGGGAQAAIVRGGGRPTAKETIGYLDRVQQFVRERTAKELAKVPEAVDAARVAATDQALVRSLPDTPDAVAQVQRAADIVAESGGRAAEQTIAPVRDFEMPEFKEWFGDSKVVDADGAPLRVFHGTDRDLQQFDTKRGGGGELGSGSYFTESHVEASSYAQGSKFGDDMNPGANVVPVYLSLRNPFDATDLPDIPTRRQLVARGFDGIVDKSVGRTQYVAFKPEQIKSAIGNSGKFDPNSASLTDPLRAGERSPREAANSLPSHDSITVAGDEPAKTSGEGFKLSEQKPQAPKVDPVAAERQIVELRKRESILKSLLDCLEAA